ncbi:MAG TPA: ATP-binding protein [Acidimicrobiia bacterium]|nr:ATP-binding protein [Acidimicrobiia bacterium]
MATIELPPEPASPAAARRFVTESLASSIGAPVEVATLLVSELVTNAVLHARTPMVLNVTARDGSVRVEVQDCSAALPALRYYDRTAPTGRGLQMLDVLASQWGVDTDDGYKTVWFELAVGDDGDRGPSPPRPRRR